MLAMAVDEGRRRQAAHDRDPPADERIAVRGKVKRGDADRHPACEPRLDRVPVGRGDIEGLPGDFRPREIGDQALCGRLRFGPAAEAERDQRGDDRAAGERGGEGETGENGAPPRGGGSLRPGQRQDAGLKRSWSRLARRRTADRLPGRGEPFVLRAQV
jgi:hypothetical protein